MNCLYFKSENIKIILLFILLGISISLFLNVKQKKNNQVGGGGFKSSSLLMSCVGIMNIAVGGLLIGKDVVIDNQEENSKNVHFKDIGGIFIVIGLFLLGYSFSEMYSVAKNNNSSNLRQGFMGGLKESKFGKNALKAGEFIGTNVSKARKFIGTNASKASEFKPREFMGNIRNAAINKAAGVAVNLEAVKAAANSYNEGKKFLSQQST